MKRRLFKAFASAALAAFTLTSCSEKEAQAEPATATATAAATAAGVAGSAAASAPNSETSKGDIYELASRGTGFTVGVPMAANTVYVFFDTTCPHCAQLWASSKPLLGRLKIVWMPIGLLRQTSGPQGATILAAADPAAAMAENEASVLDRKGGIAVNPALSEDVLAKVKANTELFMKTGAESVPLIVFKNSRTGERGSHAGAVDAASLAAMVGI